MELCQEFLVELLYTYCKRPYHKKYQNVFNAECPVCKEGKSAGRSRRLFYFPNKGYFYCHNCCKSWRPFDWVKEVAGLSTPEIIKRNNEKAGTPSKFDLNPVVQHRELPDLPEDSIDLTDPLQVEYYGYENYVKLALEYIQKRRLLTAVNSCKKFYISLEDKVHKNRLVIPFFDENKKVVCYQTRSLADKEVPRYLTKFGEKDIFNKANIDPEVPYIFIFEGPIDSMFVKNGVAVASLSPTEKQEEILNSFNIGYEKIYVFDNDKNNEQTAKRIRKHIESNKRIFVWPKEFNKFKDFNEICCNLELDEIPWKFVVKNSAVGPEALLKTKISSLHQRSQSALAVL